MIIEIVRAGQTITLQECAKDKEPLEDQKEEKDCALMSLLEAENEK